MLDALRRLRGRIAYWEKRIALATSRTQREKFMAWAKAELARRVNDLSPFADSPPATASRPRKPSKVRVHVAGQRGSRATD